MQGTLYNIISKLKQKIFNVNHYGIGGINSFTG